MPYNLLIITLLLFVIIFILKKQLYIAVSATIIITIIIYQIDFNNVFTILKKTITSIDTINVILILYLITFLQKLMHERNSLTNAQKNIAKIFNNKRTNTLIGPTIMGFLPSASAIYMACDMVEANIDNKMDKLDKAFISSYFRHTCEAIIPTYSAIIILLSISKCQIGLFLLLMSFMVIVYLFLGYIFFLKEIPKQTNNNINNNKIIEIKQLLLNLFPIELIIILVLFFNIDIILVSVIVISIYIIYTKINIKRLIKLAYESIEKKVLITMLLIFVFKEFILSTDDIAKLPLLFTNTFIPNYVIFAILIFFTTMLLGNSATYAILIPIAITSFNNNYLAEIILLNCMGSIAMQISPTHLCIYLACDYFKVNISSFIKKGLLLVICFIIISFIYYFFLKLII